MIDEREIRAALERPLDGDQEACERAWRVVSAAAPGTRTARSPRRGSRPRLLLEAERQQARSAVNHQDERR